MSADSLKKKFSEKGKYSCKVCGLSFPCLAPLIRHEVNSATCQSKNGPEQKEENNNSITTAPKIKRRRKKSSRRNSKKSKPKDESSENVFEHFGVAITCEVDSNDEPVSANPNDDEIQIIDRESTNSVQSCKPLSEDPKPASEDPKPVSEDPKPASKDPISVPPSFGPPLQFHPFAYPFYPLGIRGIPGKESLNSYAARSATYSGQSIRALQAIAENPYPSSTCVIRNTGPFVFPPTHPYLVPIPQGYPAPVPPFPPPLNSAITAQSCPNLAAILSNDRTGSANSAVDPAENPVENPVENPFVTDPDAKATFSMAYNMTDDLHIKRKLVAWAKEANLDIAPILGERSPGSNAGTPRTVSTLSGASQGSGRDEKAEELMVRAKQYGRKATMACKHCHRRFWVALSAKSHLKTAHMLTDSNWVSGVISLLDPGQWYPCSLCPEQFETVGQLCDHELTERNLNGIILGNRASRQVVRCRTCSKLSYVAIHAAKHVMTCHGYNDTNWPDGIEQKKGERDFWECCLCHSKFGTVLELYEHELTERTKNGYLKMEVKKQFRFKYNNKVKQHEHPPEVQQNRQQYCDVPVHKFKLRYVGPVQSHQQSFSGFGANLSGPEDFGGNLSGSGDFGANLTGSGDFGGNLSGSGDFGSNTNSPADFGGYLGGYSYFGGNSGVFGGNSDPCTPETPAASSISPKQEVDMEVIEDGREGEEGVQDIVIGNMDESVGNCLLDELDLL